MRLGRLDLNLLVALDAMLETRNISVAARQLNLSQSALSGALMRLRLFFEDEILVQRGRQMVPTPRAEELAAPVRQILMLVRSQITTPTGFEPATAERRFRMVVSDYVYDVLVGPALVKASRIAPKVTFEVGPTGYGALQRLEQGEIDLFISIDSYLSDAHPKLPLFEDRHAVVCWAENREVGDVLELETFMRLGHVAVHFGSGSVRAYTEDFLARAGINRRIEVQVPGYASLPVSIVGTQRLAMIWHRHALYYAERHALRVLAPPIDLPIIRESIQWHSVRDRDEGLQWLISLIRMEVAALD